MLGAAMAGLSGGVAYKGPAPSLRLLIELANFLEWRVSHEHLESA
jgi:hypothetical protein